MTRGDQPAGNGDDLTRFLCAAAHLDKRFADGAIREFLVEPTRWAAPSPGVNAGIVLTEVIAARMRRKVRDFTLVALIPLFVVACFLAGATLVLAVWFIAGVVLAVFSIEATGKIEKFRRRMAGVPLAIITVALLALLISALLNPAFLLQNRGPESSEWTLVAGLALIGTVAVLLVDELVVRHLVTTWFRPNVVPGNSHGYPPTGDRWSHSFSPTRYFAVLDHYFPEDTEPTEPTEHTPVVVYRGHTPFVGAGKEVRSWAWAVPLDHRDDEGQPGAKNRMTTESLYANVREELSLIRQATPLSPSRRLAELRIFDQVIVSADELVERRQSGETAPKEYLPSLRRRPVSSIDAAAARALAAETQEWARYYLCLQLRTWGSDLVLSVFTHFAMDEEMLYVEWTSCVLLPVKARYQQIDGWSPSPVVPALNALNRWVALPVTVFGRALDAFTMILPIHADGHSVNPARYGADGSLREMAADDGAHNYFQLLDLDRYLKIMDARFVHTVGRVLDEHGYSSELFRRQASTVTDSTVNVFSGNFSGPVFAGTVDNRGGGIGGGGLGAMGTAGTSGGPTTASDPHRQGPP